MKYFHSSLPGLGPRHPCCSWAQNSSSILYQQRLLIAFVVWTFQEAAVVRLKGNLLHLLPAACLALNLLRVLRWITADRQTASPGSGETWTVDHTETKRKRKITWNSYVKNELRLPMEITAPCISGTVFIIGGANAVAIWQPIYISCTSFFSFLLAGNYYGVRIYREKERDVRRWQVSKVLSFSPYVKLLDRLDGAWIFP